VQTTGEWFFVCDLHGSLTRYQKLFEVLADRCPAALLLGGDILPSHAWRAAKSAPGGPDFIERYILRPLRELRERAGRRYPPVFVILGNDDGRYYEESVLRGEAEGLWTYLHGKKAALGRFTLYGYSYVPPTPFLLKDWERYDVSRYVDPGGVPLEEGTHSTPVAESEIKYSTIKADLEHLVGDDDLGGAAFLFHAPPHKTNLDRLGADGKMIDRVPLELHVGSIAIRRFIEARQPLVTMHGHIHESARLMGSWQDQIGRTRLFSAAHDGPELAVVRFDPEAPERARRDLV
jgi:Icc-related predicted phosphoesterase